MKRNPALILLAVGCLIAAVAAFAAGSANSLTTGKEIIGYSGPLPLKMTAKPFHLCVDDPAACGLVSW